MIERANAGDRNAQYRLACCYLKGVKGLKQSPKRATQLFRKAADQGMPEAQWKLAARALAHHDDTDALYWCQLAADQSHPLALGQLALFHLEGKAGVTQNTTNAILLYQLAADRGNRDALFQMAILYETGGQGGSSSAAAAVDYREAARCYIRLARDFLCHESMFRLGNLYMMGDGVPLDSTKAFLLWEKAATCGGHEGAQSNLTLRDLATTE